MTYEEFKTILVEEGITNDAIILEMWDLRPYDDLDVDCLRFAAKQTLLLGRATILKGN